jgi:uncharacterized protein (TIGR03000 family)
MGYGCYGCCGGYYGGGYAVPATTTGPEKLSKPRNQKEKKQQDQEDKEEQARAAKRARLTVQLPTDAKLYIDGKPVKSGARRSFTTPDLKKGERYYYEVRAEVVRDGKPVSETKRVIVQAGKKVNADFRSLGTVATVKAP